MWKKQQKPSKQTRNVQQPSSAKVFSYYQSRSPDDSHAPARSIFGPPQPRPGRLSRLFRLRNVPTLAAVTMLTGCLLYISTLETTPILQIVGEPPLQGRTLIKDLPAYQPGIESIFDNSYANRSKMLINTDQLASEIQRAYPELGEVAIVLPLVNRRPVVKVQPPAVRLVLASPESTLVVDERGKALAKADEVDRSVLRSLPVVQDQSGLQFSEGKTVLPVSTVSFISSVTSQLQHKQLQVSSIALPALPQELHVRLDGVPYFIKFNLLGEARQQAGTFLAVKERLEEEGKTPESYIDVRVPEKAFYK